MGRPPLSHHSGNARKKTFFFVDLFPKVRPAFSILIVDHDTLITTIIILINIINIINIIILITREKDDVLEVESEGRDADDELAARLEAGEVVSLGGKVLILILMMLQR